jgi:hypothetical protein
MSYDPDCFRNINAEKFNVNIELHEPKISQKVKQPKSEEPKNENHPIQMIQIG